MKAHKPYDHSSEHTAVGGGGAAGRRTLTSALPASAVADAPVQLHTRGGPPPSAEPADDPFAVHLEGPGRGRPPPLIVEEDAEVQSGQVTKSRYLAELRAAVIETASQVLDPTWSAGQCPDLQRIFAHYATLDAAKLEGVMKRFARVSGATTHVEYVARVCARIAGTLHRWGTGVEMSWDIGASEVPAAFETAEGGGGAAAGAGPSVQLHASGGAPGAGSVDPVRDLGAGDSLDAATAGRMGAAFGDSFADVVVHTDGAAASATRALGADALATGNHVAFAAGEYQPGTPAGDGLIAHELAHVIQQRGASAGGVMHRSAGVETSSAHERDADDAADAVVARLHHGAAGDAPIRPALTVGQGVQRGNRTSDSGPSGSGGKGQGKDPQPPQKSMVDSKLEVPIKPKLKSVDRILPGVQLPKANKDKWNFGQDEEGERAYNTADRLLGMCEELRLYAIKHQHIVEPLGEDAGQQFYEKYGAGADYSSSYHSAGGQNKPIPWRDAGRLGYDLNNEEIRALVSKIADAYHSMMYISDVSRTGILLQ